jgi:hypothetical protein
MAETAFHCMPRREKEEVHALTFHRRYRKPKLEQQSFLCPELKLIMLCYESYLLAYAVACTGDMSLHFST